MLQSLQNGCASFLGVGVCPKGFKCRSCQNQPREGLANGLWSLAYQLSEREVTAGWSPSEEWNISYRWGLEPI